MDIMKFVSIKKLYMSITDMSGEIQLKTLS